MVGWTEIISFSGNRMKVPLSHIYDLRNIQSTLNNRIDTAKMINPKNAASIYIIRGWEYPLIVTICNIWRRSNDPPYNTNISRLGEYPMSQDSLEYFIISCQYLLLRSRRKPRHGDLIQNHLTISSIYDETKGFLKIGIQGVVQIPCNFNNLPLSTWRTASTLQYFEILRNPEEYDIVSIRRIDFRAQNFYFDFYLYISRVTNIDINWAMVLETRNGGKIFIFRSSNSKINSPEEIIRTLYSNWIVIQAYQTNYILIDQIMPQFEVYRYSKYDGYIRNYHYEYQQRKDLIKSFLSTFIPKDITNMIKNYIR